MVKPYSARKAAVRNVLLPATLPKWHRIVIFGLFCHFSVKQIFTFPTHFEDSFCSIWAIFPFCALLAVFHTLNSRDFLRFSCCFIFSWFYDRERFRASFPHTFPQVAITRFRPQPHCAGIMDDKLPGRLTPFFVENLFYQTLWDIHSAIHFKVHVILGLISYLVCGLSCAIFFVSTGRNSISEFGQTPPFLAAF